MAIQFPTNSDFLTRSSTYLNRASSWTRLIQIRNGTGLASGYRNYITDGDPTFAAPYIYLGAGSSVIANTVVIETFDGVTTLDTAEFTMTDNTWYWAAEIYDSAAHTLKLVVNGTLIGTLSVNLSTFTFTSQTQRAGSGPGSYADDETAYCREWQSVLTIPQLTTEATSPTAVITSNLLSSNNLNNVGVLGLQDQSGNGRVWTSNGSPVNFPGPLITSQYGGVVGFTTNFSGGGTNIAPIIEVGNASNYQSGGSGFRGFQVWYNASGISFGDGINNPVSVNTYVRYSNNGSILQTSNFLSLKSGNQSFASWYSAPMQTVELAFALSSLGADNLIHSDGWFSLYINGSLIVTLTGLKTHDDFSTLPSWNGVRVNCFGYVPSLYVSQRTTLCTGYGQSYSTPAPVVHTGPPIPSSLSDVCVLGTSFPIIFNENFIGKVDADVFSMNGGFWQKVYGNLVDASVPSSDLTLTSGFLWGIAGANVAAGVFKNSLTPLSLTASPPAGNGTIIVTKVTHPTGSSQSFSFTSGGGLSPGSFSLTDGGIQTFSGVTPGSGYSIAETPVTNWVTTYVVSNGSPVGNITVAANEVVTVTVTNTAVGNLTVNKVTVPAESEQTFNVVGTPSPLTTFTIGSGGSRVFSNVPTGTYSVVEDFLTEWTTSYAVNNGSPNTAITVSIGENVVVTITNFSNLFSSGIYKIEHNSGKTNDTVYVGDAGATETIKIPDPFASSYLVGSED